jgi:hypothetical protein
MKRCCQNTQTAQRAVNIHTAALLWCVSCCIMMLSDHSDSIASCQYSHNCPVIVCHLLYSDAVRSLRQHSELSMFTQLPCYGVPVAVLWCCQNTQAAQWAVSIHTAALFWCASCCIMMLFLHRLIITLQQVHTHIQSKFCTVCELVLVLVLLPSNSSTSGFIEVRPEAAYIFSLSPYPFYLSFNIMFQKPVSMQYVTIQSAFLLLTVCWIFLSPLTLSNTSSFLTWSVQPIFSVLQQHHI